MRTQGTTPEPDRIIIPFAYRIEETAKSIGLGRTIIFRLIRDGQLKAIKVGRRTLIPVVEIEAFLARCDGTP